MYLWTACSVYTNIKSISNGHRSSSYCLSTSQYGHVTNSDELTSQIDDVQPLQKSAVCITQAQCIVWIAQSRTEQGWLAWMPPTGPRLHRAACVALRLFTFSHPAEEAVRLPSAVNDWRQQRPEPTSVLSAFHVFSFCSRQHTQNSAADAENKTWLQKMYLYIKLPNTT